MPANLDMIPDLGPFSQNYTTFRIETFLQTGNLFDLDHLGKFSEFEDHVPMKEYWL